MTEKREAKAERTRPADAVAIPVAGQLVGLTAERIRQLIASGHAVSAGRGHVRLPSLLSGYCRFLREEAGRPESEGVARGHDAKAALIAAATERRRGELIERTEAEFALTMICETAVRHLRTLPSKRGAARGLPDVVRSRVSQEVDLAIGKINEAHQAAVRALATGNFAALEGGGT